MTKEKPKTKPIPPPPPKITPRPAPEAARPTPPAPTASIEADAEAKKLEKADTVPVVIIPPLDPDTALAMENGRLAVRVAALEAEARLILKTAVVDYTRLTKLLEG